ncbi:Acetyltransferase (GNAT) domain-containing protein [Paraoerskovia marina]|uniref:Lysine N-acyltransferase MbtK n=1 Tax=Paraoerskovia marina TaxID=545619 RepID=A0A1H1SZ91_9CELL|nr:GNAT family N-acetyltransferase [Paraoerskovia marina]SDS53143.1 Acetyltransferase (GNAT) domain-containing protein [Paraoerskovia marina]
MTTPDRPAREYRLDRLASGRRGQTLCTVDLATHGSLTVDVLNPDADLDVLHAWVTRPSSRFWGLGELSRTELRDLYAYVDDLETHHAFLVRWDGQPVVLLQTYAPEHDPLGEVYDVLPGDVGIHFLLGDRGPRDVPLWPVLAIVVHAFVVDRDGVDRVVVEPDTRNAAATRRIDRLGFRPLDVVHVGEKRARLSVLARDDAAALAREARAALRVSAP